jgi:hypothetical protein
VGIAAAPAMAAVKTFSVAPFTVNGSKTYAYLEQSIPQMFASRLFWQEHFEPSTRTGAAKPLPPADETAAEKARAAANADYIIWGSVTVVGNACSIDVRVRSKEGTSWPLARESDIQRLIPDLRQVADAINAQVFQRPQAKSAAAARPKPASVNQMNPGLVHNETSPAEVYINPQFRYAGKGADESRLRSQSLNFASVGMEICDAAGLGKPQIFLLEEKRLHAFRIDEGAQLTPLGDFELPASQYALSIRSLNMDGGVKLIVNSKDEDENLHCRILSFDGKTFKEYAKTPSIYLDVVKMPPLFKPTLIGQRANPPHLFIPGVSEAVVRGGKIELAGKIQLPQDFQVFNFAYIPTGAEAADALKLVMLDSGERLRLYSEKGARMFTTEDTYSGSVQGIYVDAAMPGMGREYNIQGTTYFIPMRMLAVDLDNDGNYEIIVNKPISTASTIFGNYRSFPQSEIHSMQWDGLGLSLVWKTRRIRGSVVDYAITDANHDGIPDLVVCVNTHPGPVSVTSRKTIVMLYPLDLSKADPGTQPSVSE